jgi:hypothetical protein
MSEVLQANIFFLITGIAVIVFTFLLCIALYHFIRLLAAARRIMARLEAGSEVIASDLDRLRTFFLEKSIFARIIGALARDRAAVSEGRTPPKRADVTAKPSERRGTRTELKIKGE